MKRMKVFSVFFVLLIMLQVFTGCEEIIDPPPQTDILSVKIIDVGQGDCIYISLPNGENMLIDAGERVNSKAIIDMIKAEGKDTLTYVIATHPHADHIGGLSDVIDAFDVKNVYMPRASHTTVTFERLLNSIEKKGLTIQTAKAGKTIVAFENLKAEFLAPGKDSYDDLNNYSAVIMLSYNDKKILFMGDAEKEIESEILSKGYNITADVIKIGHHGSDTSSTENFIKAVNPSVAVICVGKGNDYGHPTAETLSKLTKKNIDIWRTDEKGTIVITCDGEKITLGGV